MSQRKFVFGDNVRHPRRPVWGVGSVVKIEETTVNGRRAQRVSVRFPNVGLKTMSTDHAELQLVSSVAGGPDVAADDPPLAGWDQMGEDDWLAPLARRKVEEAMVAVPSEARDPFTSLRQRLALTLDLFRFDRTGRSLVDWAIAQSGLVDPLSRFARQELEQHFDRWAASRASHLQRLLDEAAHDPSLVKELSAKAPPAAREAVRRLTAKR